MRGRILRTTLGLSLGVITLMGIAMWWGHWVGTSSNAQAQVEREADTIAVALHDQADEGPLTADDLQRVLPVGHRLELRFDSDGTDLAVGAADDDGPESVEVVDGIGTIRLVDATGTLGRNHWTGVITIVAICLALAAVAIVVALRASRRLTVPISDFASDAERLSSGDLRPSGRRTESK